MLFQRQSIACIVIICVLTLLAAREAHAQDVRRVWSSPFPSGATGFTYSFDCQLYAYTVFGNSVVRCDAITGSPLDTTTVPLHSGMAYFDRRLYILLGRLPKPLQLAYMDEGSDSLTLTDVRIQTSDTVVVTSAQLISVAAQRQLILHTNITRKHTWENYEFGTGEWRFIDPGTNSVFNTFDGSLDAFTSSADSKVCFAIATASVQKKNGGALSYTTTLSDYEPPIARPRYIAVAARNDRPMSTGVAGHVLLNASLYDYRFKQMSPPDKGREGLICNVAPGGWMLGIRSQKSYRTVGIYDLVTSAWTPIDSFGLGHQWELTAKAFSQENVIFVEDVRTRTLRRYNVQSLPARDSGRLDFSKDSVAPFDNFICTMSVFTNLDKGLIRWYFGDSLIASTYSLTYEFTPETPGLYTVRAEIVDSAGKIFLEAKKTIKVTLPIGMTGLIRASKVKISSISISRDAARIGVTSGEGTCVLSLSDSTATIETTELNVAPESVIVAFTESEDSPLYLRTNQNTLPMQQIWYRSSPGSDVQIPLITVEHDRWGSQELPSERGFVPTSTNAKLLYNRATRRCFSMITTYKYSVDITFDAGITVVPLDGTIAHSEPRIIPRQSRILDADAGYGRDVVLTYWHEVSIHDATSGHEVDLIICPPRYSFQSAMLIDNKTLVTTAGVMRKSDRWSLKQTHPFNDGLRVIRLPNNAYYFVLRVNANVVGHIVDVATGDIVFTLNKGIGTPTCAVYDHVRRAIHIGDASGIVSTWPLPKKYVTAGSDLVWPEQSDLHIAPNPTDDIFTIDFALGVARDGANVSLVNMAGLEITPIWLGSNRFAFGECASGVYYVVVRSELGIQTQMIVKR